MWLEVGNIRTKVVRFNPNDQDWLADYLSFEDVTGRYRRGGKVKRDTLYNHMGKWFPSGFLPGVMKAAADEEIECKLVDTRARPCEPDPHADLEWLRDYQRAAVDAIVQRHHGMLWLPTGAGKTEVMVGLTRALPCNWLAMVHRSQLADDMASRYELRSPGLRAGRVLEGRWDIPGDSCLTVATFQSIHRALDRGRGDPSYQQAMNLLQGAQGFIVDEAHTLPANTFFSTAMLTNNAYYRVGLSGTPLARGDSKSMFAVGALGPVIYRVRTQTLIDRGVLATPTCRLETVNQESAAATWASVYAALIVSSKERNARVVEMVKRAAKPGLVFVQQVEHGKLLEKLLLTAGVRAEFVWGAHSVSWRKSHIKRLEQGHFDVLICSSVFNEGIDIPALRSVTIAAGGKSLIASLQRLGRGMRVDRKQDGTVHEGGDAFEVWDILDTGNKWTARHAQARLHSYQNEGFKTFVEPAKLSAAHAAKGRGGKG